MMGERQPLQRTSADDAALVQESRLLTLSQLARNATFTTRRELASALALESLAHSRAEVEFISLYLLEPDGRTLRLLGSSPGTPAAEWPLSTGVEVGGPVLLEDGTTLLLPLRTYPRADSIGLLVVGLATSRPVDQQRIDFFDQAAHYVAAALSIASADNEDDTRIQVLALQDHALQTFFVIGLMARAALVELSPEQVTQTVAAALVNIIEAAASGREHLRDAIFASGQRKENESDVVNALHELTHGFQERTGIEAELAVRGARRRLPQAVVQTLQQAATEALTNVEHQSEAGAVLLSLNIARRSVTLSVHDDGLQIPNPTVQRISRSAKRFSLRGVGQRVRDMGGTFVARPARDGGFLVRASLPLSSQSPPTKPGRARSGTASTMRNPPSAIS